MKKRFHWFFYSYALVDQDFPLCQMIPPIVPDQCAMKVQQGKSEHSAVVTHPLLSRCSPVCCINALCEPHKDPDARRPQLQTAAFIHAFSKSWHKGCNSATVSKGTPSSCCFCASHNYWDNSIHPRSCCISLCFCQQATNTDHSNELTANKHVYIESDAITQRTVPVQQKYICKQMFASKLNENCLKC